MDSTLRTPTYVLSGGAVGAESAVNGVSEDEATQNIFTSSRSFVGRCFQSDVGLR